MNRVYLIIFVIISLSACMSSEKSTDDTRDILVYPDIMITDVDTSSNAPEIISVYPQSGYEDGGIEVTINGKYFQKGLKVFFGNENATIKLLGGTSTIVVINPPHSTGIVDIIVENPDGKKGVLSGGFEYKKKEEPIKECVYKKCEISPTVFKLDSSKINTVVSKVELAAQFTNWQENRLLLNDDGVDGDEVAQDGIYSRAVYLRSGEYEYKFIVNDNIWIQDPENENVEPVFQNSIVSVADGCTPVITGQNINNGDLLNNTGVNLEVSYDLNGRQLDKSAVYFIIDGKYLPAEFDEENKKITLNTQLSEGVHTYSTYLRDMECNSLTSPSTIFMVNTSNKKPIANAGYTQIVEVGRKVVLDGTLSEDPYQRNIDNFDWQVVESPESVSLSEEYATDWAGYNYDPNSKPPEVSSYMSFIPEKAGYYKFSLKVSNQNGESDIDYTDVYVLPHSNSSLKPEAIVDIKVNGNNVTIDASNSKSANSGQIYYKWIQDIKNPEQFEIKDDPVVSMDIKKDGTYFIYLVVNDGVSNSDTKSIFIRKNNDLVI